MPILPISISYVEIFILLGVWLNALINLYKFFKEECNDKKEK